MPKKRDETLEAVLTFKEWLNTKFLAGEGNFITDFKRHAMNEAWMAGVIMGQKMSLNQIREVQASIVAHDLNPHCW